MFVRPDLFTGLQQPQNILHQRVLCCWNQRVFNHLCLLCSCCAPASPKPPPPRASFVKEASLAPLCLHMGMFGQSSCLHTTLASIEQQPLIPDDTGRRVCVSVLCCLVNLVRPSIVRHCVTNMGSMVSSSAVRGSIGSTGKCGRGVD